MSSSTVELYIYDLSRGMAATLSPMIIGKCKMLFEVSHCC